MATITPDTTSTLALLIQVFYEKTFLDNLKKTLTFYDFAKKYSIPRGFGPSIYFFRYTKFAANTTPLTEAVVPDSIQLTDERVSATVQQFGDYVVVSDWILGTHISGPNEFINQAVEELAYRAKNSIDQLVRNALCASAGAVYGYANSKASLATVIGSTDTMTASDIRKSVRTLLKADVPFYDSSAYVGIIGPGQQYNLQGETNTGAWIDAHKYTSAEKIEKGEIGKLYAARLVVSNNLSTLSQSGTVTECPFFGKDAVACVDVTEVNKSERRMEHIQLFIKKPGESGVYDPINQMASIGYKFNHAGKRLNDSKVVILRTGETP